MKKICTVLTATLITLGLVGCSSTKSSTKTNQSKTEHVKKSKSSNRIHKEKTKTVRKKAKKTNKQAQQSADNQTAQNQQANDNSQAQTQQPQQDQQQNSGQQSQQQQPLTQSQINMQRGYDPNGNPLLPGQDHAAGSNPDGSPDAWVQGQIDWEKQNGYLNADGTPTDKGQQAIDEVNANASYDYDDTNGY